MHELSLLEGVLGIVEEARRSQGFRRVTRIVLEVGALSGVESEALEFCFEAVVQGTLAEGAALELVEQRGLAWCAGCAAEVPIQSRIDLCPRCGGVPARVLQGLDLRVKALEVEG